MEDTHIIVTRFSYGAVCIVMHQKLKIRKVHADEFSFVTALNFINVHVNKLMDRMLAQAVHYQRRRLFLWPLISVLLTESILVVVTRALSSWKKRLTHI